MAMRNEFDDEGSVSQCSALPWKLRNRSAARKSWNWRAKRAVLLAAEAQKLANTDPLTQLPNRRCTFDRLESMTVVAEDCGSPLSVVLFDIDHFKAVNDGHGHQVGDAVLQTVAELSRRQARLGDVVGRIGGEEFVWLVAGTPANAVRQLAERLRRCVVEGTPGSSLPRVTISAGLAHFRMGDTGQSLLARADAALYLAKDNGRNRVKHAA